MRKSMLDDENRRLAEDMLLAKLFHPSRVEHVLGALTTWLWRVAEWRVEGAAESATRAGGWRRVPDLIGDLLDSAERLHRRVRVQLRARYRRMRNR